MRYPVMVHELKTLYVTFRTFVISVTLTKSIPADIAQQHLVSHQEISKLLGETSR